MRSPFAPHPASSLITLWIRSAVLAALAVPAWAQNTSPLLTELVLVNASASEASPPWTCARAMAKLKPPSATPCTETKDFPSALAHVQQRWKDSASNDPTTRVTRQIRVLLAPGQHRLAQAVALDGRAQPPGWTLNIEGLEGQNTRITGAVTAPVRAAPPEELKTLGIPEPAWPHILRTDLPAGLSLPPNRSVLGFGANAQPVLTDLFVNEQRLSPAIWPTQGHATIAPQGCQAEGQALSLVHEGKTFRPRGPVDQALVRGFFRWDWAEEHIPILQSVPPPIASPSAGAHEAPAVLHLSAKPEFGMACAAGRVHIVNIPEGLTRAGQRYIDRHQKAIYFWPHQASERPKTAELAVAENLLKIHRGSRIRVQDLMFEKARGDAIAVTDSQDIQFERIQVRLVGNRGLTLVGSERAGVSNSVFEDLGEGGIVLSGGDRQTLKPGHLYARNNRITRYDVLIGSYRPAIDISGVKHEAVDNVISEGQHAAIIFRGNDHLLRGNEISRVGLNTKDVGAIYIGRDWTARGHRIEANYIHDLPRDKDADPEHTFGVTAIYLDDQASGIHISHNVIHDAYRGILVGGGRDNTVEQNVFVDVSMPVSIDDRGLNWQKAETVGPSGMLQQALQRIPYQSSVYQKAYPELKDVLDAPGQPRRNRVNHNAQDTLALEPIGKTQIDGYHIGKTLLLTPETAPTRSPRNTRNASRVEASNASTDCATRLTQRLHAAAAQISPAQEQPLHWPLPPTLRQATTHCPLPPTDTATTP